MELGGYEVVRLKPEIPRFAELVRGAKQICDSFLGKEMCIRDRVYPVTLDGTAPAGIYPAEIVTEQISPMSFLTN